MKKMADLGASLFASVQIRNAGFSPPIGKTTFVQTRSMAVYLREKTFPMISM